MPLDQTQLRSQGPSLLCGHFGSLLLALIQLKLARLIRNLRTQSSCRTAHALAG